MSDSLQPHGLQHAMLTCPSLFFRVFSGSCPSNQRYYLVCRPFPPLPAAFPSIRAFPSGAAWQLWSSQPTTERGSRATQGARAQSLSRVRLHATLWTVATRLLCPCELPGKNTGVGCHFLLQGIFPTQGWNPCLFHCQADSFTTVPPGKANTDQCSSSRSASDLLWDLEPVTSTL